VTTGDIYTSAYVSDVKRFLLYLWLLIVNITFTCNVVECISNYGLTAGVTGKVPTRTRKSWNLRKEFSMPGKSWKMTVVMESRGIPPIGHGTF